MPRTSDADFRRWSDQVRKRAAVEAVRSGQAVILAGLQRRCPVRGLVHTIRATPVGVGSDFVGGFVTVTGPHARRVERRHPFVGPTYETDGPRAVKAMLDTLARLL